MLHENEVLSSEAFINEFSRFPDLQINTKSSLLSNALPMASSDFIPCLQWPDRSGFAPDSLLASRFFFLQRHWKRIYSIHFIIADYYTEINRLPRHLHNSLKRNYKISKKLQYAILIEIYLYVNYRCYLNSNHWLTQFWIRFFQSFSSIERSHCCNTESRKNLISTGVGCFV